MPGKVNPVMCESMMQLTARVIGNDSTITVSGASGGQSQLNIMMPVMGQTTLESIDLLSNGVNAFVEFCAEGLKANEDVCDAAVEQSLSMVTSLNPLIGYEMASALAKEAFASGKTIRELCLEKGVLDKDQLQRALLGRSPAATSWRSPARARPSRRRRRRSRGQPSERAPQYALPTASG